MINTRRREVTKIVEHRFYELIDEGHGPQRHEGAVTRQMLVDRVLDGIDPMTGTRTDGVTGGTHRRRQTATRITTEDAYVAVDAMVRRTPAFQTALTSAQANLNVNNGVFRVRMPISDALGSNYRNLVEGVRRVNGTQTVRDVDFTGGTVTAVFQLDANGRPMLMTMYPEGN